MRRALRLMRENTDSSQETRSRIVLLRYGLPCPEVNYAIRLKGYSHVFFADMAYPDLKIIIEYDGRHHASRWLADSKRREALEDEGWLYIQVTAENLRCIKRAPALSAAASSVSSPRMPSISILPPI